MTKKGKLSKRQRVEKNQFNLGLDKLTLLIVVFVVENFNDLHNAAVFLIFFVLFLFGVSYLILRSIDCDNNIYFNNQE